MYFSLYHATSDSHTFADHKETDSIELEHQEFNSPSETELTASSKWQNGSAAIPHDERSVSHASSAAHAMLQGDSESNDMAWVFTLVSYLDICQDWIHEC